MEDIKKIKLPFFQDARGSFLKPYSAVDFANQTGIQFDPKESFFSVSRKNVLRGMHFQLPPHDHGKFVFCMSGRILDVALDLRKESKTFGQTYSVELNGADPIGVFLPKGFAHGFVSLEDSSLVGYFVDSVYSRQHDQGVLWSSFGFDWPSQELLVSDRDKSFPNFADFETPF